MWETRFDPWVGKIPWKRKWQPTPVLLPRESHGQRSLVGYSLWGRQESNTSWVTETIYMTCIHFLRSCFQFAYNLKRKKKVLPMIMVKIENEYYIKPQSVQFSRSVLSNSLWPHGLQHDRLSYPSPTPGACSNSCPSSRWCHPTISSSVVPFSPCLQFFPASGSFPRSQFFASGGQSIVVSASASVLPMNIQDWFPLGWTGWIFLLSKGYM